MFAVSVETVPKLRGGDVWAAQTAEEVWKTVI